MGFALGWLPNVGVPVPTTIAKTGLEVSCPGVS
jgi:hypothetical protein